MRTTKLELQQHNTRLAEENTLLRMELSILRTKIDAQTTPVGERRTTLAERMAARRAAVQRLVEQNPQRKSFTEAEVLGAMD